MRTNECDVAAGERGVRVEQVPLVVADLAGRVQHVSHARPSMVGRHALVHVRLADLVPPIL